MLLLSGHSESSSVETSSRPRQGHFTPRMPNNCALLRVLAHLELPHDPYPHPQPRGTGVEPTGASPFQDALPLATRMET